MRSIHLANLDKTRPVLVVTRSIAVGRLRTVTVSAITSTVRGIGTEVAVGAANGLDHDSVVNMDNIFTIDFADLGRRIGHLLDSQEQQFRAAVLNAFDVEDE